MNLNCTLLFQMVRFGSGFVRIGDVYFVLARFCSEPRILRSICEIPTVRVFHGIVVVSIRAILRLAPYRSEE